MSTGCDVWFYHLERSSAEQVLPTLLERSLARGWRALVVTPEPSRLNALDERLWSYAPEAFLPHGLADEPAAARQPILLSISGDNLNGAAALFRLDGAQTDPTSFTRCVDLFDGRDEEGLASARARWRSVRASGFTASYWRQGGDGRWIMQG